MNDRPKRPSPRTLSAAPPPSSRSPQASRYVARFPALATVLGAVIPACHAPECGDTRAAELESHGASAVTSARAGHASEALREVGVALGLARHPPTRGMAPGQTPAVGTTPQPVVVPTTPQIESDGNAVGVSPLPTTVPHTPPPSVRETQAAPHAPPNATTPRTTREFPLAPMGRMRHVTPSPRGGNGPIF